MSNTITISGEEMDALREAAAASGRSVDEQAGHWLKLGRASERNAASGSSPVDEALRGLRPVSSLTQEQQEAYFDRFASESLTPTEAERAFWLERKQKGLGVGLDDDGRIIEEKR